MGLEGEAGASARRWNLKLIDNFLPQFVLSYALKATAQNSGLKELAEVELFATDLRDLKILHSKILLELNQFLLEFFALPLLVIFVYELQLFGQSYIDLIAHGSFKLKQIKL